VQKFIETQEKLKVIKSVHGFVVNGGIDKTNPLAEDEAKLD